jgi:hypothetical protein
MELTDAQIERQDFVDSHIFHLMNELNTTTVKLEWDIEMIAEVRDSIQAWLLEKTAIEAKEFYPYTEIKP